MVAKLKLAVNAATDAIVSYLKSQEVRRIEIAFLTGLAVAVVDAIKAALGH